MELGLSLAHVFTSLATKTAEDVAGFFLAANFDQPTWRLGEDEDNGEEEEKGDDLEGDREAPDERAIAFGIERASVLEPVGNDDTKDVEGEFDSDELSSGFVLGSFGSPDRNNGVQDTSAPTVNKTGEDHPGVVHGRRLKSGTEDSPSGTKRDGLDAAILVTEPTANQATYERTDVIDGNLSQEIRQMSCKGSLLISTYNASLEQRVIDDRGARLGIRVTKVHGIVIVILSAIDATHHTLVITEEKDGKSSDTVDGYEKAALLKLVNHIASWNEIHGCRK